jgi:hypothetical protein
VSALPQTPKSENVKSRVFIYPCQLECRSLGRLRSRPSPANKTTTIVNLNPSQVAQTLPLNLGLADPSFCDVQQRGFIRASELFQSMKSGFMARKSRRTCEQIPSWDGDSERLAAGPRKHGNLMSISDFTTCNKYSEHCLSVSEACL